MPASGFVFVCIHAMRLNPQASSVNDLSEICTKSPVGGTRRARVPAAGRRGAMSSQLRLAIVATGVSLAVLLVWHTRRRLQKSSSKSAPTVVQAPTEPVATKPVAAPVAMAVHIAHDDGEASQAIAALVSSTMGEPSKVMSMVDVDCSQLNRDSTGWVFVVEVDREGDSTAGRKLSKALKAQNPAGLNGAQVAVLALARSVCSFSAASGGMDKFRGGARLQSALVAAGASPLCQMGCAEVEMEEVEVSVVPWAKALAASVRN